MEDIRIRRRGFMQGMAGAFFLAGVPGHRVDGAELVYDLQRNFPLAEETDLPDAVRMLAGYLKAYSPPKGMMAAGGGWMAVYDMIRFGSTPGYVKATSVIMRNQLLGQVAIKKSAAVPEYEIQMSFQPTPSVESLSARIACSGDPVAALKNWEMDWACRGTAPAISYTNHEQAVVEPDHFSVMSWGNTNRFELTKPLTCLWTLMDAVRSLPAKPGWSQEFDMYMDLSSLRRNQSLSFSGRGSVGLASGLQELNFYEQIGDGIEPIHYAVDEHRRTLFVTQGQLGWGLNRIEVL